MIDLRDLERITEQTVAYAYSLGLDKTVAASMAAAECEAYRVTMERGRPPPDYRARMLGLTQAVSPLQSRSPSRALSPRSSAPSKPELPVKSYTTADGTTINLGEPNTEPDTNEWDGVLQ